MSKIRWGIFGTGFVATKFALSLKMLGNCEITAVASRSPERAQKFISGIKASAKAASYEEVASSNNVDVIYIATPPSLHKDHALLCMGQNKAVLIEKPFAVNASEARIIADAAKANDVFCMEAMWTRFTPLVRHVKRQMDNGELGDIHYMSGNFCIAERQNTDSPLFNPLLGGGVLLDRAVYPISLATHLIGAPTKIAGQLLKGINDVDLQACVTLGWGNQCTGQFHASLVANGNNDFFISGSKSTVHIKPPIYRPFKMKIANVSPTVKPSPRAPSFKDSIKESHWLHHAYQKLGALLPSGKNITIPYAGNAYHYQAQEVYECLRSFKKQSEIMPLSESIAVIEIIDKIRSVNNEI